MTVTTRPPAHQIAYARMRDMILFGQVAPGRAVTIEGLVAELGVGMTPVREALRRLIAEGALVAHGNRRVTLPRLDEGQLDELDHVRRHVEPQLARLAAPRLSAEIVLQMQVIDDEVDAAIMRGDIAAYLRANHRFHFTLYEASEAAILLSLARAMWLRFGPSLRVVCATPGMLTLPDRHKDALAALRAGDAEALAHAIEADVTQGTAQMRAARAAGEI